MSMMVMAVALVTILLASSLPAGAQTGQEPCPEGTLRADIDEGFVCYGIPTPSFFCPEGYVEVPRTGTTDPQVLFFCQLAPPDSGGSDGSGGGGSDGGDSGGGSGGSGGGGSGGGSGGSGGGGGATPITQDSVQESQVGELNQNFNIN